MTARLICGDVRDVLATLDAESVDAVVTDPPYELGFMGRSWDRSGIANSVEMWREVGRVLKPGGHLLSFGGTRTHHRMMCAIEDAGFEIRDCLMWMFGSGFPKSLDVSKAIDKAAGAEREVVGARVRLGDGKPYPADMTKTYHGNFTESGEAATVTAPATPDAERWQGWGTALKPGYEPIVLARKPLSERTVAANVLRWGTGALNVDACRVGTTKDVPASVSRHKSDVVYGGWPNVETGLEDGHNPNIGRWPANVLLDEDAAVLLDAQSGTLTSGEVKPQQQSMSNDVFGAWQQNSVNHFPSSSGGASRFFYVAKASREERNRGLLPEREVKHYNQTMNNGSGGLRNGDGSIRPTRNNHPTVKPIELMQYLVRLITPPGGVVLDPFCGSGSTLIAAAREGCLGIGIDREAEYIELSRRRIEGDAPLFNVVEVA